MYRNIKFLQTGETWHILPEMGTFVVRIDAWDWSTGDGGVTVDFWIIKVYTSN